TLGNQSTAVVSILDDDGTPNQQFVGRAFLDVLGRPVDDGGLAYWNGQLGQAAPRAQVAATIDHSAEYFATIIQPAYLKFLGRAPDANGLSYWVTQMQHGLTDEQLEAGFVGSPEFYLHAGNTD